MANATNGSVTDVTDADLITTAASPAEVQSDAGRVTARPLSDLMKARGVVARGQGWSPWAVGNALVPPGATGPNDTTAGGLSQSQ